MHLRSLPGPTLECQGAPPSSALFPLSGLPLPPGLMVVWSASALQRAFDLLANRPLHGLPVHSGNLGDNYSLRLLGDSGFGLALEGSDGRDLIVSLPC